MKMARLLIIALLPITIPTLCQASPVYFLITGQTAANTTIDSDHEMEWIAPTLSPTTTCLVTNCQTFAVTQFDATFDWLLGGGTFTIKVGGGATDGITLRLWEGNVGGTLASPTGALLESAVVSASSVSSSYTPTSFLFLTAAAIQAGHHYVATLTSNTGTTGNAQYFIKGIDVLNIQDSNGGGLTDPVPEPSTWAMMAGGIALALVSRLQRARRA
jgi:hypothetical protein